MSFEQPQSASKENKPLLEEYDDILMRAESYERLDNGIERKIIKEIIHRRGTEKGGINLLLKKL